jgi:hypothetical protein
MSALPCSQQLTFCIALWGIRGDLPGSNIGNESKAVSMLDANTDHEGFLPTEPLIFP